jgi:subtilase family serine protease
MSVSNPPSSALIGGSFTVTDTVVNQGAIATVTKATTRYYLSLDQSMDASDVRLGYRSVASLAVGASSTGARTVTIPTVASGIYYLFGCADDGKSIVESNEANNCRFASATVSITTTTVTDQP